MGKLLQKLVHGLVPSWLTKVKSSGSSRKALPFFKAETSQSSSSVAPPALIDMPSAPSNNTEVPNNTGLPIYASVEEATQLDEGSSSAATPQSSTTPRCKSDAERIDSFHRPEECASPHVKERSHKMCEHKQADNILPGSQSGRYEAHFDAEKMHLYFNEECETLDVREQNLKVHQQKPGEVGDDLSPQCQAGGFNVHDSRVERCSYADGETLETEAEIEQYRKGIIHRYSELGSRQHHQRQSLSVCFERDYKEFLGLKRKSGSLEVEVDVEDDEEEDFGSDFDQGGDIKRWAWKRRKGETGILSCELPESICSIVGNGRAVVKQSLDPQHALWESMVEMIVGNGLHELGNLEFLLFCYLSLNEPQLYPLIQASFLQVLKDLEKIA